MDNQSINAQTNGEEVNLAAGKAEIANGVSQELCSHSGSEPSDLLRGTCGFFVAREKGTTSRRCDACTYYSES